MQRNQIYYIRLEIGMKLFNKYKFSDKRQSLGGIISTIMGLLALASLIYGIYISFKAEGYAGLKVGSLGLLSLLISVIGTFIGLLSFKEDDKFYIEDMNSANGTLVNGEILIYKEVRRLKEGDRITFADISYRFLTFCNNSII